MRSLRIIQARSGEMGLQLWSSVLDGTHTLSHIDVGRPWASWQDILESLSVCSIALNSNLDFTLKVIVPLLLGFAEDS